VLCGRGPFGRLSKSKVPGPHTGISSVWSTRADSRRGSDSPIYNICSSFFGDAALTSSKNAKTQGRSGHWRARSS
jgi:hypothetical protein